jgi:hypothetical protein
VLIRFSRYCCTRVVAWSLTCAVWLAFGYFFIIHRVSMARVADFSYFEFVDTGVDIMSGGSSSVLVSPHFWKLDRRYNLLGFEFWLVRSKQDDLGWYLWIPYWPVIVISGIFLGIRARDFLRDARYRHRIAMNLCPKCGYDLRESPDRCPECGLCRAENVERHA